MCIQLKKESGHMIQMNAPLQRSYKIVCVYDTMTIPLNIESSVMIQ